MVGKELPPELPQQPTAGVKEITILTPERGPVLTAQAFISKVRHTILGDNPEPQRVIDFEASLAGKTLGVMYSFFQLKTAEEQYPFVKNRYVGSPSYGGLQGVKDRHLTLFIGGQYAISIHEDGRMELKPRYHGGNDRLVHDTGDGAGFGVNINGKTGQVEVPGEGEKQITPNTNLRLEEILDTIKSYYDDLHNKLPLYEILQTFEIAPDKIRDIIFPPFPTEQIQALRHGK